MTCSRYDDLLADLAFGAPEGSAAYDDVSTHAATCDRCASRLQVERALAKSLRDVAAADEGVGASPAARVAVLAAFRASAGEAPSPTSRRGSWIAALAVAATIAVAAASAALLATRNTLDAPASSPGIAATPATQDRREIDIPLPPASLPAPRSSVAATRRIAPRRQPVTRAVVASAQPKSAGTSPTPETAAVAEVTTEYIPLTYVSADTASQSGHVVRVSVSRAALATFGLRSAGETRASTTDTVKADVIVGDDGVALAIRFVQ